MFEMFPRWFTSIAVIIVLGLSVFTTNNLGAAEKKHLDPIRIVYWNTLYHCLLQIGVSAKTFEKEGLQVDLVPTNHSSIDQVKAILGIKPFEEFGRDVFAGGACGGSPYVSIGEGIDMVIFAGLLAGGSYLIAKPEMAAKLRADPKNFKGKRIGRPQGVSLTSMILSGFLANAGIDHLKDFTWKLYPDHEAVIDGILKGEVDAGDTYAPLQVRAKREHGLEVVHNTMEMFPFHPCSRLITTRAKLAKDREKYVRFVKGLINAHQFFIRKPNEAIKIVRDYTGYSQDEVETLKSSSFKLEPDPLSTGLIKFWEMVRKIGYVKSNADIRKFIDTTIYRDALAALIKEEPANPYYKFMEKQFETQNP
jgi:NitT/TauT family transport system substrate-binding protein